MKKFLPIVLLVAIISGIIGYQQYNKSHAETKDAKSDIVISPAELLKNYETDEAAADKAYLDKILEVSGVIKTINEVPTGSSLSLDTGSEASITCEFESHDAISGMKVGDKVTIKGFCSGKLIDVVLVRCSL
ncbi:MAG: hypothetical protein IPN89_13215 [Saprospiraceae bacterium]|nr:hypothetical protein [Saprospiraceae bacterium]